MASVKVAVRVRPLNEREKKLQCKPIIQMDQKQTFITNTKLPSSSSWHAGKGDSLGREKVKKFTYDYSYWSMDQADNQFVSQQQVFEELGSDVVQSAHQGYNACIFAYGQTGSGKTYTMMGDGEDPGLIPRISEGLFVQSNVSDISYKSEVSYLEIYNERVRDLLRDKKQNQSSLRVREHPKEGPYVQDLSKHFVSSYSDIEDLIEKGNAARTTAATSMNEHSSRSHAIFTIVFNQAQYEDGVPSEIRSKINLVDLAGSERADTSDATGERLKEGGSINKSLVTLGHCISRLADMCDKSFLSSPRKQIFIPYRDSVLTWLLKDSLGGNSRTIMIATVSPADCNYAETLSTLRYASQAKKIVNKPTVNEDPNVKLIRELREENARLRALLGEVVDVSPTSNDLAQTKEKLTRNEEKIGKLTATWADKWQDLADVLQEHNSLAFRAEGIGLVVDSELPYLLALDGNILSTGMKLYHLKEGCTEVGRLHLGHSQFIELSGPGIEDDHCTFVHENSEVYISPSNNAMCVIDNIRVHKSTKLSQGCHICLGQHHIFRFNHPRQAAKLREQYNGDDGHSRMKTWHTQWTKSTKVDFAVQSQLESSSNMSMNDEQTADLEEKRKALEQLEEQHCLAEAQRLAQIASHKAERERLKQQEDRLKEEARQAETLKQKAIEAQKEIKRMSASFEQTIHDHIKDKNVLEAQRSEIKLQQEKLEQDKAKAKLERQKLRTQREEEQARLSLQRERQEEEADSLREEQHLMEQRYCNQEQLLNQQKIHMNKMQTIEKDIYHKSMEEMRKMVESEVKDMVDFFSKTTSSFQSDHSLEDLTEAEINQLKLTINPMSVIPLQYLQKSVSVCANDEEPSPGSHLDTLCELKPLSSETLDEHVAFLATQVDDIHCKVCEALQRKYSSVLSSDDVTPGLDDQVISQFSGLRSIYDNLEKFSKDHSLKQTIEGKLKDYDGMLSTVDRFLQIHKVLQDTDSTITTKQFLGAIDNLEALHKLFVSLDMESDLECNVQKVLKTELSVLRERLLFDVTATWSNMLKWTLPSHSSKQSNSPSTVTFEVTDSDGDKLVLNSAVHAAHRLNMLDSILKKFCDYVLEHLIKPAVSNRGTLLQVIDELDKYTLRVVQIPHPANKKRLVVPPIEAFQKLEQIFTFIHKPLTDICVPGCHDEGQKSQSLVDLIGQRLGEGLFECIYNDCLSPVVCKNNVSSEQWQKYTQTVQLTENFQEMLSRLGFLRSSETSLMDRMNNVSVLFANLKSQEILKQAHQLMTQDFMKSVCVSTEHPLGTTEDDKQINREKFVQVCREQAGTTEYKLPTCHISIPVCSVVCQAYDLLREALGGNTEEAMNLCHALKSVFELYCDVVPAYHRENLQKRHLMAALHHNNCMYVGHHLITLDKSFRAKLEALTASNPDETFFSRLIPQVRSLGNEHLTEYLNMKKDEIFFLMQEAQGFSCVADDQGHCATQVIKKMLHHLKQISSVWQQVLPVNVYCRTIGSLLDAAVTEIVDSILCIAEFSSEDCDYLQTALSRITQLAADYFKLDNSKINPHVALHEYVPSWMKFKEIVQILHSRLQDVADRWADGKGPLAMHVTGDEVRKLVRAIFENTTRREILLKLLSRRPSVHLT